MLKITTLDFTVSYKTLNFGNYAALGINHLFGR